MFISAHSIEIWIPFSGVVKIVIYLKVNI